MKPVNSIQIVPKISLSALMGFIFLFALSLAAFRSSSQIWMLFISNFSLLLLLLSIVGACVLDGRQRAYCIGFAIMGWGHCLLAHSSWFGDDYATPLKHALEQAGDWMHPHEITVEEFADFGPKVMNFVRIGRWISSLLYAGFGGMIACVFLSRKDET